MNDDRVAVLERQVRKLRRLTAVLAIGFVWLVAWRLVPGPDTVEAREFRMRDASGALRGALAILDDGRPLLRLNDVNGKARAMLYVNRERGGGLRIMDTDGERRIEMELHATGEPEMRISDPNGRTRTLIRLDQPEKPSIVVLDEGGAALWSSPGREAPPGP